MHPKQLKGMVHCSENPIYVFPEKELRGLSSNFHIHVSVSDLNIFPGSVHIFSCSRIGRPMVAIYKSLTDTWMWKLGRRPCNSFSGNICYDFSALSLCKVNVSWPVVTWTAARFRKQFSDSVSKIQPAPVILYVNTYCISECNLRTIRIKACKGPGPSLSTDSAKLPTNNTNYLSVYTVWWLQNNRRCIEWVSRTT